MINEDFIDKEIHDIFKDIIDYKKLKQKSEEDVKNQIKTNLSRGVNNASKEGEKDKRQNKIKEIDKNVILKSTGLSKIFNAVLDGISEYNFHKNIGREQKNNYFTNSNFKILQDDAFKTFLLCTRENSIKINSTERNIKGNDIIIIYKNGRNPSLRDEVALDLEDAYVKEYGGKENLGSTDSIKDVIINDKNISLKISNKKKVIPNLPASADPMANAKKNGYSFEIVGYKYTKYSNVMSLDGKPFKNYTLYIFESPTPTSDNIIKVNNKGNKDNKDKDNLRSLYKKMRRKQWPDQNIINDIKKILNDMEANVTIRGVIVKRLKSNPNNLFNALAKNSTTGSNIYNNINKYVNYLLTGSYKDNGYGAAFEENKHYTKNGNKLKAKLVNYFENYFSSLLGKSYKLDKKEILSQTFEDNSTQSAANKDEYTSYAEGENSSAKTNYFNY